MRKHYLFWMILLLPFLKLNAQTYCTPNAGTSTAYYLKNAIFSDQGALYYDATAYQAYVNNSITQMVNSYPGGTVKVHLEFAGSGAKALVWVDWNANGDFNDFYENPIGISPYITVDDQFFIPPSQAPGIYRIRVQMGTGLNGTSSPCGPNNNSNGNFVDFSLKIDPTPTCFVPTAITTSNITNAAATISWTAPTTSPGNGYEYYYTTSATVPDATTPALGASTTTSASISGLNAFTSYYVYVRSVCSGSYKSAWSLRGIFKTKCNPMTSMFENFENVATGTNNADCWDRIILGTGYQVISSGNGVNSSKAMYQSASNTNNAVIAVLPAFSNVNAGTNWIRLKARTSSGTGTLDVGYVTNDTDASTFVNIQSLTFSNTVYDGYEYTVVIPSTVPANARLAIRNAGVTTTNIYWDEVYWEPKPTCLAPFNVVLSNTTSASVDIAWNAPASLPALGYDIYYSTSSTPPSSSTTANVTGVTASPYTLAGLNAATTYYIWVRSRCTTTDQSAWTNVSSVLTLCALQTSLFDNFDSYNVGLITNVPCWGIIKVGNAGVNINANNAFSGTKHVLQRSISVGDIAIAVLPGLSNVNAGTNSLSFRAYCSVNTGKLEVGYVTNPTDANTFTLIQQLNITNTTYTPATGTSEYSVVVPNTVPASARLAIRNTYAASGNAMFYYDDISWAPTVILGINEILATNDVVIYPNPFTDIITVSGDIPLQSVAVYDLSGKMIQEIRGSEKTISLHDLSSGVYMIKLIMKNGTAKTIKAVKK